jgi:hypothetical protein
MSVHDLRNHKPGGHWARRVIPVGTGRSGRNRKVLLLVILLWAALIGLFGYVVIHLR